MLTAKRTSKPVLNKKRHGQHHHKSKGYKHVYWPYLPLAVSIVASILISGWNPSTPVRNNKNVVLAYATSMSTNGLLSATNSQRANNGQASLQLNSQLNQAAQAKANDMSARNYWSHNTPEGQEPWIFIDQTGYKYQKAGENLAYGFLTSEDTVTGWMNSASHKANMLDGAFTDVGFGFANSENYQQTGQETIVVAMYAKPQTLAAQTPATGQQTTPKKSTPTSTPAPTPEPTPPAEPEPVATPATTDSEIVAQPSKSIARVQTLTGNRLPWAPFAIGLISGLAVMVLLLRHTLALRHLLRDSERFILHHTMLDSVLVSLLILSYTLTRSVGFVLAST